MHFCNSAHLRMVAKFFVVSIAIILLSFSLPLVGSSCTENCIKSQIKHNDPGIKDQALMGHTFKTFFLSKNYDCHFHCFQEHCRCKAFQMFGSNCELLEENRVTAPQDFTHQLGFSYFDMKLEYKAMSSSSDCMQVPCSNGCCSSNPCRNGGTCSEVCDDAHTSFTCSCVRGFTGKRCHDLAGKTCKEHREHLESTGKKIKSGVFPLQGSQNIYYTAFCDFESEEGFAWTVIESFTKENRHGFTNMAFYKNYEVNQDVFSWDNYRLSLSRIQEIGKSATHFRATCRFDTEGPNYTDYLRASLSQINILKVSYPDGCQEFEYINVRGYSCYNCTAHFVQTSNLHAHSDTYYGPHVIGCQFNALGALSSEDDFGYYERINPVHRCMANESSTTQWWLGEK